MLEIIKQKLITLAEMAHRKIFGEEMSEEMRNFLGHLSWSFFGIALSSLVLFTINILAGRIFGPEGYGKYNLVLVYANIITMLILLGLDTVSIKYIADSKNDESIKKHLSNSLWIVLFMSLVFFIFGILVWSWMDNSIGINRNILLISILFGILLSLKNILDSFMRSLRYFKFQSSVKIIESFVVAFFFLGLVFAINHRSFEYYIYSLILGSLAVSLLYFFRISNKITTWDYQSFEKTVPYLKATITLIIVGVIVGSIDKIFIGRFIGFKELGIYSAYITATIIFSAQLVLVFDNVFFPMVSKVEDKSGIIKKIDRMVVILSLPIFAFFFIFSYLILKLFGNQFSINLIYIGIFSFLAFVQISSSFYKNIVYSMHNAYQKFKKYSYIFPLFFLFCYSLAFIFNFKNLNYVVAVYALYMVLYFILIRLSCKYE